MTGKEGFEKAIELVEKETMIRYKNRKNKVAKEKYAIDAVVSTLVSVKIMLENIKNQIIE